jgi:hypothetical protein
MFTFHYKDTTTTVTVSTEATYIHDVVEDFRKFLLAVGFQPETVNEVIPNDP